MIATTTPAHSRTDQAVLSTPRSALAGPDGLRPAAVDQYGYQLHREKRWGSWSWAWEAVKRKMAKMNTINRAQIQAAVEQAGIQFIDDDEMGGFGLREKARTMAMVSDCRWHRAHGGVVGASAYDLEAAEESPPRSK